MQGKKHYFVAECAKKHVVVHLFATRTEASEMWEQRPPRTVAARGETVDPVGLVGRLKKRWGATSGVLPCTGSGPASGARWSSGGVWLLR